MSLKNKLWNNKKIRDKIDWLGEWYGDYDSGGDYGVINWEGKDYYCMFLYDMGGSLGEIEIFRDKEELYKNYGEFIGKEG